MPYRGPLAMAEKAAAGGRRGTEGGRSTAAAGTAKPDQTRQTA